MLNMLGLPQHRPDLSAREDREAIKDIYRAAICARDGIPLEIEVNERWRQPGVLCLKVDEFANTSHGKLSIKDPLYFIHAVNESLPPVPWPVARKNRRPLAGIKVLDLTKVVAGPTITRILALMGADVLRISTSSKPDAAFILYDGQMGKRDTEIDLKTEKGKATFEKLLEEADVLVDGYRPGVLEKLGFSRVWAQELARRRGKGFVYARENCYGWNGEWSHRAGYQQISDCVSSPHCVVSQLLNTHYTSGDWRFVGAGPLSRLERARCSPPAKLRLPNRHCRRYRNFKCPTAARLDRRLLQCRRISHSIQQLVHPYYWSPSQCHKGIPSKPSSSIQPRPRHRAF